MLAIIPARGGSKGLLRKNLKLLNGKPLIAYTIDAALRSNYVTRVIVSTDSDEIAQISIDYGAECPFMRPTELATDSSLAIDVYLFTLSELEKREKTKLNDVVILQATSPLRTSQNIDEAIELFKSKRADSVVSFTQEQHPVSWHKHIEFDGKITGISQEKLANRQEERPTFYPNGAIYVFKSELLEKRTYYSENSYAYIMDRKQSVDIDVQEDFDYAEFLMTR